MLCYASNNANPRSQIIFNNTNNEQIVLCFPATISLLPELRRSVVRLG